MMQPPTSLMGLPSAPGAAMKPAMSGVPGATGGRLTLTPQMLEAKMHLTPQLQSQLQRIVVAGMKVMFSNQTRSMMQKLLQAPGQMPDKVAQGIAGLLGILMKESGGKLPPKLLIPAGVLLVAHAAEFLDKASMVMSDQDVGTAIQQMIGIVMKQFHMDINKVAAVGASGKLPPRGQPPQNMNQMAPNSPQPGGLAGNAPANAPIGPGGKDPTGQVSLGPMSPMGAAGIKLGGGL